MLLMVNKKSDRCFSSSTDVVLLRLPLPQRHPQPPPIVPPPDNAINIVINLRLCCKQRNQFNASEYQKGRVSSTNVRPARWSAERNAPQRSFQALTLAPLTDSPLLHSELPLDHPQQEPLLRRQQQQRRLGRDILNSAELGI